MTAGWQLLFRPSDVLVADLCFTAILSFFFLLSRQLPSELAEQNSTEIGYMAGKSAI